jgi:hypothetical protein
MEHKRKQHIAVCFCGNIPAFSGWVAAASGSAFEGILCLDFSCIRDFITAAGAETPEQTYHFRHEDSLDYPDSGISGNGIELVPDAAAF